ncbi:MAG: hypothetical protein ABIH21_05745 [Patescibacteria group bacterium]
MDISLFIAAALLGYIVAWFFAGKREQQQGRIHSIRFRIGNHMIHLHHWIWATLILFILMFVGYYHDVVNGILYGILIQGLTYSDFYKIIHRHK